MHGPRQTTRTQPYPFAFRGDGDPRRNKHRKHPPHFHPFAGGSAATTVPGISLKSTAFGQSTAAYQNVSTNPGGRIIQMVLRINF